MFNLQISGLKQSFQQLIPNCIIKEQYLSQKSLVSKHDIPIKLTIHTYGIISKENKILLWALVNTDLFGVLTITREIHFTKDERKFLDFFRSTISGLLVDAERRADRLIGRISSWYSFETILISTYLRRYKHSNFWTPTIIINQLQSLTSERYENKSCFSGFIYVSDAASYIKKLNKDVYSFEKFDSEIVLDEYFFNKPSSFRYVDGRNAFYFVDNSQKVLGIIRVKHPKEFSLIERLCNQHLFSLFDRRSLSRIWIGYVGLNDDVKVIVSKNIILTWLKSHWHFTDTSLIKTILTSNNISSKVAELLKNILITISNLRLGTLILVPDDLANLPSLVGKIDDSQLGNQLYSKMKSKSIEELILNNSVIGMLTSDGITIISKEGTIIETGAILGVVKNDLHEQIRGGGRTQAAIEASKYGVAIKVSEDGPITIYINKQEKLKIII